MGLFSKKKTSVLDFLKDDLTKIDINSFEFIATETNIAGTELKKYQKKLGAKELNLFDTIEILMFPSGEKNIFYKGNLSGLSTTSLKQFVNELTAIYGKDFSGTGNMDDGEISSLIKTHFWTGRTWDKAKPTVTIDAIQDEAIQLAILGIH